MDSLVHHTAKIILLLLLMQNYICMNYYALLTVRFEMLPFSGRKKKKKISESDPPEHFAIGYVNSDNLPLGNPALSEDQEKICRIHQNYLVALIATISKT